MFVVVKGPICDQVLPALSEKVPKAKELTSATIKSAPTQLIAEVVVPLPEPEPALVDATRVQAMAQLLTPASNDVACGRVSRPNARGPDRLPTDRKIGKHHRRAGRPSHHRYLHVPGRADVNRGRHVREIGAVVWRNGRR